MRVIALGFFDGVHKGHARLFRKACERAGEMGAKPSVITYSAHPSGVVSEKRKQLINTAEERMYLIRSLYGIEDIIVKDFTPEFAALSAEEFVQSVLVSECGAVSVVAGYDFRFGKGGEGNAEMLASLCEKYNIGCDIEDEVRLDGKTISSTHIRELIALGEMEEAERFLGHKHTIIGKVTHGKKLGSTIGFPTVNLPLDESVVIPRLGVYKSRVYVGSEAFPAVTNIGVRPTVSSGAAPRAETHIIGFEGDLYDAQIRCELCKFMREERRFASVEDLKTQIAEDVRTVCG